MSVPPEVLDAYQLTGATCEPILVGNINHTYRVVRGEQHAIVQRLNPIFGAEVHDDIEAVTEHLTKKGMLTPRLLRTRQRGLFVRGADQSVWRALTVIAGTIHSSGATPELCRNAGALLGRFHRAVSDLEHRFHNVRPGVHDTARHLAHLGQVLTSHAKHRAFRDVEPVGRDILDAAAALPPLAGLPPRIVHGDPKLNNVVFSPTGEALCLIDLDTLSRMNIPVELGDAFRSWCNPQGEDSDAPRFDIGCLRAGIEGYASTTRGFLAAAEIAALPVAIETIILELASRFCADALEENYFGWNRERFPTASAHNLYRARCQLLLARAYAAVRDDARRVVNAAFHAT